jgi:hypothetical protein
MGPQQVLRAATAAGLIALGAVAEAAPPSRERVAVIDLGPGGAHEAVREQLARALLAAGLAPVTGDGVDSALAGISLDRDGVALAAAMADAQAQFGELQCDDAVASAKTALGLLAARQAAGLAVPELPRAWTYVLLCADRTGDFESAARAATQLRALGDAAQVDRGVLARYPDIDAVSNREVLEVEIHAERPGTRLWVDFRPAGTAPTRIVLPAGEHIIAAAQGTRRGWVSGRVVKSQPTVTIPMPDQAGRWTQVAARVAGWAGQLPPPHELAWVLAAVDARVALIRHGDTVEAWGHADPSERVRLLGGADGVRELADAAQVAALIADRVTTWRDRTPDPDQALLVESELERRTRDAKGRQEGRTPWWVYATIAGALVAGGLVIYANEGADNVQRVELTYP